MPIIRWFAEYKAAFPDGDLCYGGYDHLQTSHVVDKRIRTLENPEYGSPSRPLETVRAKEWYVRLHSLIKNIKRGRAESGGTSDYSDFVDMGGIWLSSAVIMAFAEA